MDTKIKIRGKVYQGKRRVPPDVYKKEKIAANKRSNLANSMYIREEQLQSIICT